MKSRLEDICGKIFLLAAFGYLALQQIAWVGVAVRARGITLSVVADFVVTIFLGLMVVTTIRRLPSKKDAAGLEPRIVAILGTFALLLLAYLPLADLSRPLQIAAAALVLIGATFSIGALFVLGRSFSIMASARALVTTGPYRVVRHPLYLAEFVTTAGIILTRLSVVALIIGAVHVGLQLRRMFHEETVLRKSFPEYDNYASSVPMLVPRLNLAAIFSRRSG